MIRRVERFHRLGLPEAYRLAAGGVEVGRRCVPYDTAGVYVPGGRAAYPSTLVMAAVPARLAGVRRILVCTPPDRRGRVPAAMLYAARRAGVDAVFRVGGAQAVAAMATGTRSIPRADIIVGPGNVYVAAAKERVADRCAIDYVAGPTEILIVSDGTSDPRFLAADLAAQAEHDPQARCLLVTTSRTQARAVAAELQRIVPAQPRAEIIRASLRRHGWILLARGLERALEFANAYASEHLVLATRDAARRLARVRSAGSVFVGDRSACAFGDYGAGPNHILPTAGAAARSSALSVLTFLKLIPYQAVSKRGAAALAKSCSPLARLEGLHTHRLSMEIRSDGSR
jgi:histidinol dehydrogenase